MGEAGGVRHRQRLFRLSDGEKRFTRGTHRLRAPDEMLAAVRPRLALAGVTRLANITGLDRIGIPVVVSVRPNGRTLSQAAGKGITLELALLSAAMESIELFHAEVADLPEVVSSYVELARHHPVIPLPHLPLSRHSIFSPLTPERWTFGRNLLAEARSTRLSEHGGGGQAAGVPTLPSTPGAPGQSDPFRAPSQSDASGAPRHSDASRARSQSDASGAPRYSDASRARSQSDASGAPRYSDGSGAPMRSDVDGAPIGDELVAVPLDLVVLPRRDERSVPPALFSFQTTSNGLASGGGLVEALTVGLLEVIERDAVACWRVAAEWFGQAIPRVRLDSARHFPLVGEVLELLQRAGVQALVYDCTVDTEVAVYRAVLYEAAERRVGLAEGWGAHLDPELALLRALTEAAQSRAVSIAGARDDRFGRDLARVRSTDSQSRIAELETQPATVDLRERQSEAAPTFKEDIERLLARLVRIGVTQAIVVDLTRPEFADVLSVVRVIVPVLDGPGFERGHPSPRATAFAARRAAARDAIA